MQEKRDEQSIIEYKSKSAGNKGGVIYYFKEKLQSIGRQVSSLR